MYFCCVCVTVANIRIYVEYTKNGDKKMRLGVGFSGFPLFCVGGGMKRRIAVREDGLEDIITTLQQEAGMSFELLK